MKIQMLAKIASANQRCNEVIKLYKLYRVLDEGEKCKYV